jgi:hypothetical protein
MSLYIQQVIGSVVRACLAAVGGWLTNRGLAEQTDLTALFPGLALVVSAIGWSLWQKWRSEQTIARALRAPSGTSREAIE